MDFSSSNPIIIATEVVSAGISVWAFIMKITKEIRKAKQEQADKIIKECKELDLVVKNKLEAQINFLEGQLHNLQTNIEKDISNLKDNHALELKNLSERIELLRTDLNTQHSQIIGLLTKLIN